MSFNNMENVKIRVLLLTVTQYECSNEMAGPTGCLQYFTGLEGTISRSDQTNKRRFINTILKAHVLFAFLASTFLDKDLWDQQVLCFLFCNLLHALIRIKSQQRKS